MNKAEFIAELKDRLAVLTDEERQDILDEYEQHIDIKVMRGMSEDAAIADFGRIEELAADILEAYHVRADYAVAEKGKKNRGAGFGGRFGRRGFSESEGANAETADDGTCEAEEGFAYGATGWLDRAYESTWNGLKNICHGTWNLCRKIGRGICCGVDKTGKLLGTAACSLIALCRKPFHKENVSAAEEYETEPVRQESNGRRRERKNAMKAEAHFSLGRAIAGFFRACADAALWCLRWMWNLFCIGTGLLFGFGSCMVVFFMGVLVVLLVLGYPLAGVTIGWLGLTMCMVSVTIWCFSMMIGGRKRRAAQVSGTDGSSATAVICEAENAGILERTEEEEEEMIHA